MGIWTTVAPPLGDDETDSEEERQRQEEEEADLYSKLHYAEHFELQENQDRDTKSEPFELRDNQESKGVTEGEKSAPVQALKSDLVLSCLSDNEKHTDDVSRELD